MNNKIEESISVLNLSSSEKDFLKQIKEKFDFYFLNNVENKINLMEYLPEKEWLKIKTVGLLQPFLIKRLNSLKFKTESLQAMIQETLRIAGNYSVPTTLRTGIEGALVLQPLLEYADDQLIEEILPLILESEGGGLAITEPNTSGSSVAKEMESYYEINDKNNSVYIKAEKYWQGNSTSEFLLVAAKEKKNNRLSKNIDLIFVPREYIKSETIKSEGLKAVRYAINRIDATLPSRYIIKLPSIREFQNIFIRSRLQLIGMTHGIIEMVNNNIEKYIRHNIDYIKYELDEIKNRMLASKLLYNFVCDTISPIKSVSNYLLEANIVKALGSELAYEAAKNAQKLLGAKGFEAGHEISNIAIDIRPFTIFEGPNDMLYADIFDIFSKQNSIEKENLIKVDRNLTIFERLNIDSRFFNKTSENKLENISKIVSDFLRSITILEIDQIQKVFLGKIISKVFIITQTSNTQIINFLNKEMQKNIVDFQYK